jgi:hypothetical protein
MLVKRFLASWAFLLFPAAAFAADTPPPTPMPELLIYIIMAGTVIAVFVAVGIIAKRLKDADWSLKDALTEPTLPPAAGAPAPVAGAPPPPGASSSSRLIALLGMVVILILFVRVGLVAMWQLAENAHVDLSQFQSYFLAGASLFVPYVFNQIRNVGK